MKNIEVLIISERLKNQENAKTCASIKSLKFQYALRRSAQTIKKEADEIFAAMELLKPDELKEAFKKDPNNPKTLDLGIKWQGTKEVQDLFNIESLIELHKIELKDLPDDLDGKQMDAIWWLLKDND